MWLSQKQSIQQLKGIVLFNDCYWSKKETSNALWNVTKNKVEIINTFNAINNSINPRRETLGRGKDALCKSTAAYE